MTYLQEREKWITILKQELDREKSSQSDRQNYMNKLTGKPLVEPEKSKATKKDIGVVLDEYISKTGYTESHQTKLYNKHGGEYCRLIELLNYLDSEGKFRHLYEYKLGTAKKKLYGIYIQGRTESKIEVLLYNTKENALTNYSRLYNLGQKAIPSVESLDKYLKTREEITKGGIDIITGLAPKNIMGESLNFLYQGIYEVIVINPQPLVV